MIPVEIKYMQELQKKLSYWSSGDISKFSPEEVEDLLRHFLRNNQIEEIQKLYRLGSEEKLPRNSSMVHIVKQLTHLLGARGSEQDFQLPIFIFSANRSGSIYIRNSLIKSFGYTELRGFRPRSDIIGKDLFSDFGGGLSPLNGFPGFISNVHLFPSAENLQGVGRLIKRAHLIFLFRHPLASLFSYFYRMSYMPKKSENGGMFLHASKDEKKSFLIKILQDNLEAYRQFFEGWLKFLNNYRDNFSVICYEDYENNLDEAVEVISNNIGLDSSIIQFAEKNSRTNYQRDVRPDFLDVVPAIAFEQYAEVIENFKEIRKIAIRNFS